MVPDLDASLASAIDASLSLAPSERSSRFWLPERLAAEVARLTGETKTEAIRKALQERHRQLKRPVAKQRASVLAFLERKVWPTVPRKHLGKRLTRVEEDQILGYGPEGV